MSRAFLNHFANNSVRAHFPFVVPEENEAILDTLGISEKCLYQPERVGRRDEFILTTKNLLEKAAAWALPPSPGAPEEKFFEADTVWNVIVPLKTRFVAEFFGLPVKAAETAHRGVYTERELYLLLIAMFTTHALGLERLEVEADVKAGWVANVIAPLEFTGANKGKSESDSKDGGQYWPSLPDDGERQNYPKSGVAETVMPTSVADLHPRARAAGDNGPRNGTARRPLLPAPSTLRLDTLSHPTCLGEGVRRAALAAAPSGLGLWFTRRRTRARIRPCRLRCGSGGGAPRLLRGARERRVETSVWVNPSINRLVIYLRSTALSAVEIRNGAGPAAIHGAATAETPGAPLKTGTVGPISSLNYVAMSRIACP
ncbi:hypothetical protein DL763_003175 [Monosporascus cannonballus]|nr:hypothetical protein DL763_003175 [Monosporascus cannonballus]